MIKKIILGLVLLASNSFAINSQELTVYSKSTKPQVVRAYFNTHQQIEALSKFITPWEVNTREKYAVFLIQNSKEFKKLKELGFTLRIDTKLQAKIIKDQKRKKRNTKVAGINGYECYSTVEETFARMETMAVDYPNLTELVDIGDSWEKTINAANGYDMRVLKMTNKSITGEVKPVLFITSAVHAREYSTAELTTRFAEYLLANYQTNADIRWMLDHQEVHILFHNNPDGRKKAEAQVGGSPGWRKNTNQAYCAPNSNSRGADLNRNYPFGWQSSSDQCSNTYSGSVANSEPEIDAVTQYMYTLYEDNRGTAPTDPAPLDTQGIYLDIHSYSQLILWPWGYTSGLSPNQEQFAAFGKRVAFFNGYDPKPAADLYTAKGVSIDTSYGDLGVASLVYELGTAFYQNCEEFESKILPDNLKSLLYVSRVTRSPYKSPLGPDLENYSVIPNIITDTDSITVSGNANDDRYSQFNGIQTTQNVQQVETFINALPWLSNTATPMQASDGSFDSSNEGFSGQIIGTQLSLGENTIYSRASDNVGNEGAVYSQFVTKVNANDVGTVSGRITDAVTGSAINGALVEINQSLSNSNLTGNYHQNVLPSTSSIQVSMDNYDNKIINNFTVNAQQNQVQNIQLEPFCDFISDDVESGTGVWQASTPWAITQLKSASPSHSWTDSPTGNYGNNINVVLTSDDIAVAGSHKAELVFNQYCDTESGYDYGIVEINFDNAQWQEIHRCDGDASWKSINQQFDIPTNSLQMKVRFRLTSDVGVTRDGIYIDDIRIKTAGDHCHFAGSDIIFSNNFE